MINIMPRKKEAKVIKLKRIDKPEKSESLGRLLTRLVINVFSLMVVAYLIPGFSFSDFRAVIVAAIVIGLVNTYLRPILQIIALPITLVTFGIGAFLVNVFLLWFASVIVPGFEISGFTTAAIASILLTLISWFLHSLAKQ
jgi:putative membrane protein